ncbi:hypothetical protein HWV62_225 [Athelia sp. TMB]|nr:hypothetical protein HWV62_225 [Athelia sp. TMB]
MFANLTAIPDIRLDLQDAKLKHQGCISVRLSLVKDGYLIAGDGQQLALELLQRRDAAVGRYIDRVFSVSLQVPPAVVAQPIADVLNKISLFMQIADDAAKVHPYAKLAWDVISVAHKIIMAQIAIDQSIADLANTMRTVYSFVDAIEAVPTKIDLLEGVIQQIFNQTVECGMFVREYAGHGFGGRVLKEVMGASTPARVAKMADSFTSLHKQFNTIVTIQIATVSFRVQEDVAVLLENHTLDNLARLAGDLASSDLASLSGCLAGTRRDIIGASHEWALHPSENGNSNILWLYGAAGMGKSAVATTIATHFYELERLGAFIRFHRALFGRSRPSTVVLALAHQLALFDRRIAASVVYIINQDKKVLTAPLTKQFDRLIVAPLTSIPTLQAEGPIVIILDGLDECGMPDDRAALLKALVAGIKNVPPNLRFIITSRPHKDIREAFSMSATHVKSQDVFSNSETKHLDIAAYFQYRMKKIRLNRRCLHLNEDWPGHDNIVELTARAFGFFPWAVSASDFIDAFDPPKRLELLLLREDSLIPILDSIASPDSTDTADPDLMASPDSIPIAGPEIDKLYRTSLEPIGNWQDKDFVLAFRSTMEAIIGSHTPIATAEVSDHSMDIMERLGSLLTRDSVVLAVHPSFLDFLGDRERCGRNAWYFRHTLRRGSTGTTTQSLRQMNAGLRHTASLDLPDAPVLPANVADACQSWVGRLCAHGAYEPRMMENLDLFLHTHLIHWFEAMSILKQSDKIPHMLTRTLAWLEENNCGTNGLKSIVADAIKLGQDCSTSIAKHPLHVYFIALPRVNPTYSKLYRKFYEPLPPSDPCRLAAQCLRLMNAELKRNICDLTLTSYLYAVELPDELANACQSWVEHVCCGAEHQFCVMKELEFFLYTHLIHWFEAMSIIKKASGILPMLQRVAGWLTEHDHKNKHLETLVLDAVEFARNFAADIAEHPLYVYYTALPLHPPGSILYQTFHDSRVDTSVSILRDHLNIAYSSDGRRYAVWNPSEEHGDIVVKETATGQELLKIANNGKLRRVFSVAFSYDGSRIAAGGSSGVYVWDSVAGAEVIGPLRHSTSSEWARAVTWCTNGECLVSGSYEGEMILWDTASAEGNRLSTTRLPNSHAIPSVAFSSDGSQIAGCSGGGLVFVWDPLGGSIVWSVQIPNCYLPRVSFSSNGTGEFLLVKWDKGTQTRDLSTGALLPLPDSLAGAVGLSRGGFMVDLLYRRIRKDMRWEDDKCLEWGAHGDYFAFRAVSGGKGGAGGGDGANGADTEDAIGVGDARGVTRDAAALVGDDKVGGESDCVGVLHPAEGPAAIGRDDPVACALGGAAVGVLVDAPIQVLNDPVHYKLSGATSTEKKRTYYKTALRGGLSADSERWAGPCWVTPAKFGGTCKVMREDVFDAARTWKASELEADELVGRSADELIGRSPAAAAWTECA